jgi:hypothetical protein
MRRYMDEEITGYIYNISQMPSPRNSVVNSTMATILNLPIIPEYTLTLWTVNTVGTSRPSTMRIQTQNDGNFKFSIQTMWKFLVLRVKEWIYFSVCGWKYPSEKKNEGNCIIARSAWSFFFRMDTSSTKKTNKFIPYHLIISKNKYYGIKLYSFHDLFMHYIFCDVWVFYDVVVLLHGSIDTPNISANKKGCYTEN